MVRTYGLTHINLVVRDVERSLRFYGQVFGMEEYGRTQDWSTPERQAARM